MKNFTNSTVPKIVGITAAVLIFGSCLTGCSNPYNKQIVDTAYGFDRAMIFMPDGNVIEGKVQSWTDFDDSDQIQVKIDGKTYFTHSSNVVLIKN